MDSEDFEQLVNMQFCKDYGLNYDGYIKDWRVPQNMTKNLSQFHLDVTMNFRRKDLLLTVDPLPAEYPTVLRNGTSKCGLNPMDLHDAAQFSELHRQRVLCGWDYDLETVEKWKNKQQEKLKNLFWITTTHNVNGSDQPVRVGHISLDANTFFDLPELRNLPHVDEKCVLSISTFYILPEYRSGGLGRAAVQKIEELAVQGPYGSPNCRFIALNAMSKRHIYDEGWQWKGIWDRLGQSPPLFSIQEWYETLGYVSWKEEPLYEHKLQNGDVVKIWEAFMRKEMSK